VHETATLGDNVFVLPGANVMAASRVRKDCIIHSWAVIAASKIGEGCSIRENAHVVGATIGRHCLLQAGAIVKDLSVLGDYILMQKNARIGFNVKVGNASIFEEGCCIGDDSFIGDGCTIHAGAIVGSFCVLKDGAVVPAGTVVPTMAVVYGPKKPAPPAAVVEQRSLSPRPLFLACYSVCLLVLVICFLVAATSAVHPTPLVL